MFLCIVLNFINVNSFLFFPNLNCKKRGLLKTKKPRIKNNRIIGKKINNPIIENVISNNLIIFFMLSNFKK